jgi:hypothetical protein
MATQAYEPIQSLWATSIPNEAAATGMVQGSSGSVLGFDAAVTPNLAGAIIGQAPVANAFVVFDGTIP